jgi:hypothetical protein
MSRFKPRWPSTGTVLGFVAIVIAVASSASAAPNSPTRIVVHKGDIAPGAVTTNALAPGAVHAKQLAKSAVTSKKMAKESVNKRVLARGSVYEGALGDDVVTARTLAPGSVYGGALGPRVIHKTPIADLDQVAENGMWTGSNTEITLCAPGEALLGPGFVFTEPGNREVSWLQAAPFLSGTGDGVSGRISSNSGGTAKAEVMAVCLR